jgi:parallel beta-helix repeat protein
MSLTKNAHGVLLAHSNNCLIENVSLSHNIRGLQVVISDNSTLVGNNISDCEESGIVLTSSRNHRIINNAIERNQWGVWFSFSPRLLALRTTHNTVKGNYIKKNHYGIHFSESHNNTISNNVISENEYGLQIINSNSNSIYHNNFLNNTFQVTALGSNFFNTWDNGYPSGGNQWSDYSSVDVKKGLYQNESGSDGIGDTSYLIHDSDFDRYPLVPPKIDFFFQPLSPKVFDEITFSGILLTPHVNISYWKWKMSDGSAIFGQNVTHKFVEEGSYNVRLVVTDGRGAVGIIEKSVNIVGSTSEDSSILIIGVIIGVILVLSIVIGYFAWKLLKR